METRLKKAFTKNERVYVLKVKNTTKLETRCQLEGFLILEIKLIWDISFVYNFNFKSILGACCVKKSQPCVNDIKFSWLFIWSDFFFFFCLFLNETC